MKVLRGFFQLQRNQRVIALRLLFHLVRAELICCFLPYSFARCRVFATGPTQSAPSPRQANVIRLHISLLNALTRHLPWGPTCLRRAIALRECLAVSNITATLRFGVLPNRSDFEAHAWLDCGGLDLLRNGEYHCFENIRKGPLHEERNESALF